MKKNLDAELLKTIYGQYKDYLLPGGLIIISLLLFFYLIIPQLSDFTDLQKQMKIENDKLRILKNNLNYLMNTDTAPLEENSKIVSVVLPREKDFVGVLGAVSDVASKTSISLGDYQFKVGDLDPEGSTRAITGVPYLEIDLNLVGKADSLINFMKELQKTAPVNEIMAGGISANSSFLTVRFYYSAMPPVKLTNNTEIKSITGEDRSILENLKSWNNLETVVMPIESQATSSGDINTSGPF